MLREQVESKAFAELGYDVATATLEVAFHPRKSGDSSIFRYAPVSLSLYEKLLAATKDPAISAGRIFAQEVKNDPMITATKMPDEVLA